MESEFVAAASSIQQLPAPAFAELALVGRSNVGKSSLINTLLGRRKLARTSGQPGCTRSLNLYRVHHGKACFDLIDLPGYGYAKRSKHERKQWQTMIESFLNHRAGLRAILLIVDVRRGLEVEERELSEYMKSLGLSVQLIATKMDKLPLNQHKLALAKLKKESGSSVIAFSSQSQLGKDVLLKRVLNLAGIDHDPQPSNTIT